MGGISQIKTAFFVYSGICISLHVPPKSAFLCANKSPVLGNQRLSIQKGESQA